MIKIQKNKYIRRCLSVVALLMFVTGTIICFFLGWKATIKNISICISIIISEAVALLLLNFILNKLNNYFFIINSNSINIFKNGHQYSNIDTYKITALTYIQFKWIFAGQMGAGYLHIEFTDESFLLPTMSLPNGLKLYSISMSKNQAIKTAEILQKQLSLK